MCCREGFSPNG
ncbi:hypothetical protein F383_35569 [Gossypium arboreum]|uniref:Uncharacterized protein n=1 Tax=Gossypium arboreum TaxID=29729 RepID=A0A0B0N7G3_GOSAR|nr:hypothetical protein F383_35569 [Gossypium arboreum]